MSANTGALMPTYARLPVSFVKGAGVFLQDDTGKDYLDALSGIAVCNLGHAHPDIASALSEQAHTLIHTSNLYDVPLQRQLGERLCALAQMETVFFANSGAEANEAAIKLARLYGHNKGIEQPVIAVMSDAFHGRTMATLTATGNRKAQAGFEPLVPGFVRVPYGDAAATEQLLTNNNNVVAVLVEPIQGEGGIRIPPADYLPKLRQLCDAHDCLLMADEIQSGMGRSGRWFAHQHSDIVPDVMTLAKALANGVPIGACLARGKAAAVFGPGNHGSTFGGNPLACRAALTVLDVMEREQLPTHAAEMGAYLLSQFQHALGDIDGIVDIRGQGLLIGIELKHDCAGLVQQALAAGLLINVTAGRVVRLLPPLILTRSQADQIITIITPLIRDFLTQQSAD